MVSDYIRAARAARANCIQLAREYPHEREIFVRLARQWHEFLLRRLKLERAQKERT